MNEKTYKRIKRLVKSWRATKQMLNAASPNTHELLETKNFLVDKFIQLIDKEFESGEKL